jgi:hypothetical protein
VELTRGIRPRGMYNGTLTRMARTIPSPDHPARRRSRVRSAVGCSLLNACSLFPTPSPQLGYRAPPHDTQHSPDSVELVEERGWPPERYERRLAQTLIDQLLRGTAPPGVVLTTAGSTGSSEMTPKKPTVKEAMHGLFVVESDHAEYCGVDSADHRA